MYASSLFAILLILVLPCALQADEDFYELLGVEKSATLLEIRRAFKSLAVLKHPDKNIKDPDAHANFIKLAEAYEILKDPSKRSDYDLYGTKKFKNQAPPQYYSYTYYRDQFGIYDDDPLVVTLSKDDFESSIEDTVWFVNFYSPGCSHCHHLAPEWRRLSKLLEGVMKIGAVNCEDDRKLCWDLQIRAFPTLLYYSEGTLMYDGMEYDGMKTAEEMEKFVMLHLRIMTFIPTIKSMPDVKKSPWLLFLCTSDGFCPDEDTRTRVAAVLKGLVSIAYSTDTKFIKQLTGNEKSKILYYDKRGDEHAKTSILYGDDYSDISEDVLNLLPEVRKIDLNGFDDAKTQLKLGAETPWLLCFTLAMDTQKTILLKKLTAKLEGFNIGEINCARSNDLCTRQHIARYPTWGILKKGGAFEVHTGPSSLHAVQRFAKDTQSATNIHTLSPQDLQNIMSEGSPWIIGWLLTGCPPCKKMLPALRRASNHFTPEVIQFGTVDCALHSYVCSRYSVHSYPTTIVYNASNVATFRGESEERAIVDFIKMMEVHVPSLTIENFNQEVGEKNEKTLYVVEFYAPWCAPCQKLQPEWHKMTQKLSHLKYVKVGAVNCEKQVELCQIQAIKSYPTIRLYPTGSFGLNTVAMYTNNNRDASSLVKWVFGFIPNTVIELTKDTFRVNLMSKREDRTWIVLFYAPWCEFCNEIMPEFITVMQKLEQSAVGGRVNCQKEGALCHQEHAARYPTIKVYQRENGYTKLNNGIMLDVKSTEGLFNQIKTFSANSYVTPARDEL